MKIIILLRLVGLSLFAVAATGVWLSDIGPWVLLGVALTLPILWTIVGAFLWCSTDWGTAKYNKLSGKEKLRSAVLHGPFVWLGYLVIGVCTLLLHVLILLFSFLYLVFYSFTAEGKNYILEKVEEKKQGKVTTF